jgi:hypothetical protein
MAGQGRLPSQALQGHDIKLAHELLAANDVAFPP